MGEDPELTFGDKEFEVPMRSLQSYQTEKWVYWLGAQEKFQGRIHTFRWHQAQMGMHEIAQKKSIE